MAEIEQMDSREACEKKALEAVSGVLETKRPWLIAAVVLEGDGKLYLKRVTCKFPLNRLDEAMELLSADLEREMAHDTLPTEPLKVADFVKAAQESLQQEVDDERLR